MAESLDRLRDACAWVTQRARHVHVNDHEIPDYAASLPPEGPSSGSDPADGLVSADRETHAALWLTLDAINFGSGWFPTLRKPEGQSGYRTIAGRVRERFLHQGAWSPDQLERIQAPEIAATLGQDPNHELMELFARALQDVGTRVAAAGSFSAVVDSAGGSAVGLVELLAGWDCFADTSVYEGIEVPFLKRAQIATADLHRAGVADLSGIERLTLFADNLVPHVLRLDGILAFDPSLVERIESRQLIEHGSPEEVEIRACALHAVELIAAQRRDRCPAQIDQLLWLRGQQPAYKRRPRHRSHCTAY